MNKLFSKISLSKTDIVAAATLTLSFVFLLWTALTDSTIPDEAFYITIPMRLINGDGLFTDEWHLSQLSAVILYPLIKLFFTISGGTQGIILYVRLLFVIMQTVTGAIIYRNLRKYAICAILISVSFSMFSVFSLNTLSYNTMGVSLLIILICVIYSAIEKPSTAKMIISGTLISLFILCQPFGVILYGIYFVAVCVFYLLKKAKNRNIPYPLTIKSLLMTIAGILPVLAFFFYLLLKNSDFGTIFECIPGILSDMEHMEIAENMGNKTFSLFQFFTDMTLAAGIVPIIILIVCSVCALILKKKNKYISIFIVLTGLVIFTSVFFFHYYFSGETADTADINFFFLPFALAGPVFYLLPEKKNHKVLILFWCTGIVYALFMTVSSNVRLHTSVNGYIISSAATLLFAKDLFCEIKSKEATENKSAAGNKFTKIVTLLLALTVFGASAFHSTEIVLRHTRLQHAFVRTKMTDGIFAGIKLPSEQALLYTNLKNDAKKIKEILSPDDRIFVCENIPSIYLEENFYIGAFSGWFIEEQLAYPEIRNRFRDYYSIFPENIPDYIYVPAYKYAEFGLEPVLPKMAIQFPMALFDGTTEDIGSGILIKVTGIKDEQA